jgi:hypothetical protein
MRRSWPSCCARTCGRRRGSPRRRCASYGRCYATASLVRFGTQLRNRIYAIAADHGNDRSGSYWTGPGCGWLGELDLPPVSREIVSDCLAATGSAAPGRHHVHPGLQERELIKRADLAAAQTRPRA